MRRRYLIVFAVVLLTLSPLAAPSSGGEPSVPTAGITIASPDPRPVAVQGAALAYKKSLPIVAVAHPLSSDELIDQALAAGRISAEAALIYKVYATFGDPRLPAPYHGDDSQVGDSHIVTTVQQTFSTLSPSAQALLERFLRPPAYVGSWYWLRSHPGQAVAAEPSVQSSAGITVPICTALDMVGWGYVDTIVGYARIWYREHVEGERAKAEGFATAMVTIWPKLTGLMGAPLTDGGTFCWAGSDRLDIYLVPVWRPYTGSLTPPGCKKTPAYIVIDPYDSSADLAHEFMHAIQFSYKTQAACVVSDEYNWLAEASAEWAMEYVYPGTADPRQAAPFFLDWPRSPLDFTNYHHEYGAWMLFYFLQRTQGASAVKAVWDATVGNKSLEAVNDVISNRFAGAWQDFILWNWNRPPVDFYSQGGAGVFAKAKAEEIEVKLDGESADFQVGPASLQRLSSKYTWLHFKDANVRTVMFFNGLSFKVSEKPLPFAIPDGSLGYVAEPVSDEQKKGASVWALIKINGAWKDPENWTNRDVVTFCRDKPSEHIEELVLIFGNSAFQPRDYLLQAQDLAPTLYVSDLGCWKWVGTSTSNFLPLDAQQNGTVFTTHADDLVWENKSGVIYPRADYELVKGHVQWSMTPGSGCGVAGSGTANECCNPPGTVAVLRTANGVTSGKSYRGMVGDGTDSRLYSVVETCAPYGTYWFPTVGNWFMTPWITPFSVPKGSISKGQYDELPGRWTWDLAPSNQP